MAVKFNAHIYGYIYHRHSKSTMLSV